jgi:radical SAM superfamily enzyme YgiQ (UPF0313 family)
MSTEAEFGTSVLLLFMPPASPSYVPLGLASLRSYMAVHHPGLQVEALDLNLETWYRLAGEAGIERMVRFMRGMEDDFFDPSSYLPEHERWCSVREAIELLLGHARHYLSTGELDQGLRSLLEHHARLVLERNPRLVGISVMYPAQLPLSAAFSRFIKSGRGGRAGSCGYSAAPAVVLGGASLSFVDPGELLRACPEVDGVVQGEGEQALAQLARGEELERVPGLSFRHEGSIRKNPKPDTLSMDLLPSPDFSDLDPWRYLNPTPVLPVLFSRGCAWRRCLFCAHNFSFSGYRARNVSTMAGELERFYRRGIRHFYFADQFLDAHHLDALAGAILQRGLDIRFHYMGKPDEGYTPGCFEKLYAAGCRWISWGVETGSPRLLQLINKNTRVEVMGRVLRDAHRAGINNLAMMIFGLPTSTDQDLRLTLDFLCDLHESIDAVSASAFCLYRNTGFEKRAGSLGMSVDAAQELFRTHHGAVRSFKLSYREANAAGDLRKPRAQVELMEWERRKRWVFGPTFRERLCAEHYLLYASRGRHAPSAGEPGLPGYSDPLHV